jgi:hypothetical protein
MKKLFLLKGIGIVCILLLLITGCNKENNNNNNNNNNDDSINETQNKELLIGKWLFNKLEIIIEEDGDKYDIIKEGMIDYSEIEMYLMTIYVVFEGNDKIRLGYFGEEVIGNYTVSGDKFSLIVNEDSRRATNNIDFVVTKNMLKCTWNKKSFERFFGESAEYMFPEYSYIYYDDYEVVMTFRKSTE